VNLARLWAKREACAAWMDDTSRMQARELFKGPVFCPGEVNGPSQQSGKSREGVGVEVVYTVCPLILLLVYIVH
jgi:hypothetical protein